MPPKDGWSYIKKKNPAKNLCGKSLPRKKSKKNGKTLTKKMVEQLAKTAEHLDLPTIQWLISRRSAASAVADICKVDEALGLRIEAHWSAPSGSIVAAAAEEADMETAGEDEDEEDDNDDEFLPEDVFRAYEKFRREGTENALMYFVRHPEHEMWGKWVTTPGNYKAAMDRYKLD